MTHRFHKYLLCGALAAASAVLPAPARAAVPSAIAANYDVLLNGLHVAVINERFEIKDEAYRIVSESNTVGLAALLRKQSAVLVSNGKLIGSGLRPERFEGKNGDDDPRRASAEFDWPAERLTLSYDGKTETAPLPPGTQDRISLMYQFMFFAFDRISQLDVSMTNGRKIDQYRYAITPRVEIDTPLGRMTTLHLVKEREPNESATEIWLAPQHNFFPVKVLIVERNGSRYEQIITRLDLKS
jgi:uncharacterized protein DUF3108